MQSIIKVAGFCVIVLLTAQCRSNYKAQPAGTMPLSPDYSDSTQWYVSDRQASADVFYIISTETGDYALPDGNICHYADTYNDSTRLPLHAEMVGVDTLISGTLNFYAPYYRQCSLQSFAGDSTALRLTVATDDARRALKYYLEHFNRGRPFVLPGFSQGAMIALQLLSEMDDDTYGRLVAVYALGCSITPQMVAASKRIIAATGPDDIGVTICYNSVRDTSCSIMGKDNAFAINPVNWRTDATPATLVTVPSPLLPPAEQTSDTLTVHLDPTTRLLLVDGFTGYDYVLPLIGKEGCYHSREIWLYRDLLRDNIARRTAHFMHSKPR
ncbi:MAG: DUF3089 domain-containing protein [Muribaculaceae bacterium]|nr:DUF3089 domain-containing protein [Muribaculaceae bacterium]